MLLLARFANFDTCCAVVLCLFSALVLFGLVGIRLDCLRCVCEIDSSGCGGCLKRDLNDEAIAPGACVVLHRCRKADSASRGCVHATMDAVKSSLGHMLCALVRVVFVTVLKRSLYREEAVSERKGRRQRPAPSDIYIKQEK